MKVIKICMMAGLLGLFVTSCRNADCNTTSAETVGAATATAVTDGTQAAMNNPGDTMAQVSTDDNMNGAERESGAASGKSSTSGMSHQNGNSNASANAQHTYTTTTKPGPDLKAVKEREENFTNGTGPDYHNK